MCRLQLVGLGEREATEVESQGRERTKALFGAAASLSWSCQVPGIGTLAAPSPLISLAPLLCHHLSRLPVPRLAWTSRA